MVNELEREQEAGKEDLLPHDRQTMVDSINRLLCQADSKKLDCIYSFIVHIL